MSIQEPKTAAVIASSFVFNPASLTQHPSARPFPNRRRQTAVATFATVVKRGGFSGPPRVRLYLIVAPHSGTTWGRRTTL